MPERVEPADLTEGMGKAVDVLGNRVRVAAILALLAEERATASELAVKLDVGRELVRKHLIELVRLGVVDIDPPRAEVRRRYFRINRNALRSVLDALRALDPQ